MKTAVLCLALGSCLFVARTAHAADPECDDTPENPTIILAGLAGAVYAGNTLRVRLRARRTQDTEE